jgi:hypothetical protein
MTQEEKKQFKEGLFGYLPFGLKGVATATIADPHHVDMDGFYEEVDIDVDVELLSIDIDTEDIQVEPLTDNQELYDFLCEEPFTLNVFIPYLRSLSSMTYKEKRELNVLVFGSEEGDGRYCYNDYLYVGDGTYEISYSKIAVIVNWLNEHHFDYNEWIEKGWAKESKE